jgi:GAF domain-containing protein
MPSRFSQQQKLLIGLHRTPLLEPASLQETLRFITSSASQILNVARVSVWLHTPDRSAIVCQCLYDQSSNAFSEGMRLDASNYPRYFQAIETEEIIQAHDACHDSLTSEFLTTYLKPLGITSMLDAPLHLHGKLAGVLCHEHVGKLRHWQTDEVAHALTLASQVVAAYHRDELQQAHEAMRLNEERFRTLVENAFDGILILSQKGELLYASPMPGNPSLGRMGYRITDTMSKPAFIWCILPSATPSSSCLPNY